MTAPADRLPPWLRWTLTGLPADAAAPAPPPMTPLPTPWLRSTGGPLFLILATSALVTLLWQAVVFHDGSAWAMAQDLPAALRRVPAPDATTFGILAAWFGGQLALLLLLPGAELKGPVTPAGVQPTYKINGVPAWIVTHAALFAAWRYGWVSPAAVVERYGQLLITLQLGALGFCTLLYLKGRWYPSSPDAVYTGNLLFDFFQGVELHPRLLGVNLKQWINCRVSMMGWSVVVLTFAAWRWDQGHLPTSLAVCAALTTAYLFKFFWWEGGYFHSIDIMHDRFGYYICWGVLAWVPALYCLPGLWMAYHGPDLPAGAALSLTIVGMIALWINYDADAQRQAVRATDGRATVWGRAPTLITARYVTADGQHRSNVLLASGWWGVARHFHYVPELVLAAAWTAPAGFTHALPWGYLLFLSILLVDRAGRDEQRCAAKYGPDWERYKQVVKWRMVPGVW